MKQIRFQIIFLLFFINCISRSASKDLLLGVSPEDEKYYKGWSSSGTIKCKDGSKKFCKSQLNDDFCDCPDGSDEPGTSACPNGKFYCRNAGHVPVILFSSRVNDGICDCCDGSDEYDGKIKCPNTCWEAGKVARDKLKKKIATYEEGVTIRKQEVEKAKIAIEKDEAELLKLKDEEKILKGLVQQLKERKEQIEKAEEKERLQREKEEKERKIPEEAEQEQSKAEETAKDNDPADDDAHGKIGLLSPPPQDAIDDQHESVAEPEHSHNSVNKGSANDGLEQNAQVKDDPAADGKAALDTEYQKAEVKDDPAADGKAVLDTENQEKNVIADTESLSREELGRLVASRWTGEKTEQRTENVNPSEDTDTDSQNPDEASVDTNTEEYNGYDSEDDDHRYDDDDIEDQVENFEEDHEDSSSSYRPESDDESDLSDISSTSSPSWLEKIQQTVRSIFQSINVFQSPVNTSEAAYVRKEYDESSAKLSKIQSRISSLSQKLKYDFGREKEFYSFYGQCFEMKQNKYVYKVCPFKQATQEEGYSKTRLGSWDKFEDSYRIMQFSNGDKCWNGPDRSLKVKLRCGLKNEVTDVDEPSRCEYLALLSTPALCLEDKLKELQDKLDNLNKEQPQVHDEL